MDQSFKFFVWEKKLILTGIFLLYLHGFTFGDTVGSVRLKTDKTGDSSNYEGLVQIFYNGQWGSIGSIGTYIHFDDKTASVICRILGLGNAGFEVDNYYTDDSTPRVFSYLYCNGEETDILDCSYTLRSSVYNYTYGAGVICKEFNASNLRLHGGNDASEGSLQFLYDGKWMGLCEDSVDWSSYHVACKQLGLDIVKSFDINSLTTITQDDVLPFVYQCYTSYKDFDRCYLEVYSFKNCTKYGRIKTTCSTFNTTDIRLVGGNDSSEGRVEVFDGEWKTVCKSGISVSTFDTICRQIGWKGALSSGINPGVTTDQIIPYSISCSTIATTLSGCTVYNRNYSCSHINDISVKCSAFEIGDVRLVGGEDRSRGRIELLIDGNWMTFCDSAIQSAIVEVICRMEGYRTAKTVYYNAYYGEGSGYIVTNWFYCSSTESDLNNCRTVYRGYTCSHSDDLSVECSDFKITDTRLVNGSNENEGRIELKIDGEWMTVYDSTFNKGYAPDTLCKSMGYRGAVEILPDAYFGQGSGGIVSSRFSCDIDAVSLTNCSVRFSRLSIRQKHSHDLSVICGNLQVEAIRLVDGSSSLEGRVEMLVDNEWRSVCYLYWSKSDADVLCKSLGFRENEKYYYNAYFGEGIGKILNNDFMCAGQESHLDNCTIIHRGNTCSPYKDLSVRCVACGDLSIPTNGHVTISGTSHGDFARFDCKPGYGLTGSTLRVCMTNNTWSGTEAQCVRDCGDPPAPQNGSVLLPPQTIYTATVTYQCDPGFDMVGMSNRTCLENGTWNGSSPTCKIRACGDLSIPTNGDISISGTSHGDFARLDCRPGYGLTGSALRVCMSNNTWSGTEAQCVRDCGDPPAPQNGSVLLPPQTIYTATVTYQCDPGFDMVGMSKRTCLENGMWNGSSPTCKIRVTTNGEIPPENDDLKEALLYGGIGLALLVGIIAGVIVAVCVLRKRQNAAKGMPTVYENTAFSSSVSTTSDLYDSLSADDMTSRDPRHGYVELGSVQSRP